MDEDRKQELAAKLSAIIETFESSQSEEQLLPAREDLAELWPELLDAVPIVGRLVRNAVPGGQADIKAMGPDEIREKLLPRLHRFQQFLTGAKQPSGPGNRPNRPGCFGGTSALLMLVVLLVLLVQLIR